MLSSDHGNIRPRISNPLSLLFGNSSGAGGREGASRVAYACAFLSAVAQVGVSEEIHGGVRNARGAAEGCYCRKERFDIEEIAENSSKEVHLIVVERKVVSLKERHKNIFQTRASNKRSK